MKLRNMLSGKKQIPGEYKHYEVIFINQVQAKSNNVLFHRFIISDKKKKSKEMVNRQFGTVITGEGGRGKEGRRMYLVML